MELLSSMGSAAKQVMSTYKCRGVAHNFACNPCFYQECEDAKKLRKPVLDHLQCTAQARNHDNRKDRKLLHEQNGHSRDTDL